ncbi:arabinosyltransferase B/arabinosyltransferase C [Herbihabitans rhizosphaerae]|uniref:Arabinosyltransferase B/arabinosyltransferase C n=1 Tax=Herbihabitans rhizosphaerae TaxID=1872711 RepID=A0A4Q7KYC4_9PSEU|nr:arabinosyltransferase domain-containing protein [Herbihabitans rhizosphaerae]RZS41041.1 arabinosyltransferase B/arabinosyltransferase C [Herbihabitans rhizosphaerae]
MSESASDTPARSRGGNLLVIVFAGLTILLGALAVLSPVKVDDPVVTWPKAGEQPVSTVVPLSPYRPLQFDATVPCETVRAAERLGGNALSTSVVGDQGMLVQSKQGKITITASGSTLITEAVPAGSCAYRVLADGNGVRVLRDQTMIAERKGMWPPQVAELTSQADKLPEARGLRVELHTDARYQSSPSVLKIVLLVLHALCLIVTLVLAWRRWGDKAKFAISRPRLSIPDGVVLLVSGAWVFLGPMQMDDSWYLRMAQNASESGFMGNAVYMFNITENPFVLSQYLMQWWGELGGWSLWWIRLVPVLCGLITWVLLRVALASMLGRAARLRFVPWALLAAHLLWFLPYGVTLRPEPVIVACGAAVLLFAEIARARESIAALALATVFATLAIAVSPSGIAAAAPLVMALPWLIRWLRAQTWSGRVAAILLAGAAMSIMVPIGFTDASLGDVLDATTAHQWYYIAHPWFEEIVHFNTLLDTSGWGRRLPVLLTVAVVLVVAIGSGRANMGNDPLRRLTLAAAITTAIAFVLIALSPTKWVNHFQVMQPVATLLLAAALVRSPLPRKVGLVARAAALLLTVGAVALSYAGQNRWHPFTDAGQRFGNHLDVDSTVNDLEPHFGPLYLRSPLPWLAIVLAAWLWTRWRRNRGKLSRVDGERAVLLAAVAGSVVLLFGLFAYAPMRQSPGWTVAKSGVETLFGNGCGLASGVKVLVPSGNSLGAPIGQPTRAGDFTASGRSPMRAGSWEDTKQTWHDDLPDGSSTGTGTLTTAWYPLPATGGTHVTVPLAGQLNGQRLEMQFGAGDPRNPSIVDTVKLRPDDRLPIDVWQQVQAEIPAQRPAFVRVSVADVVTGRGTWIAAEEPRLTEYRPVNDLAKQGTVFADQISGALWPCVNPALIRDGLTDTPGVFLAADEIIDPRILNNPTHVDWGGAWLQTSRTWVRSKVTSILDPEGPQRLPWGQVFVLRYPYHVNKFDLRVDTVDRGGLYRGPSLADNTYPDISRNPGIKPDDIRKQREREAAAGGDK